MEAELAALGAQNQLRHLAVPKGRTLGSNDYLGLSSHPRLKKAILRALDEDPRAGSTGSRLLTGNSERWEQLEAEFAGFAGTDAALYFSSGYAANTGLLGSVLRETDTVFSDAANHASLIDGIRLSRARKIIFPHLDLEYLERALRANHGGPGERIVVVESVFSMEGDHAPLPDLIALCERYDAGLIVDEAHATGIEGPQGRGLTNLAGRSECVIATVHPCGKALASVGAFVAGSRTLCDFLINRARPFIFTTALPPYCAAHVGEALKLAAQADEERSRLADISRYLRGRLTSTGFDYGQSDSQIIPLLLGTNEAALAYAAALTEAGFAIRAIRPPTVPEGTARLRLSLNAGLGRADMDALIEALLAAREREVVRK